MNTAKEEWARMWPLPFVAMVGVTGGAATSYSAGVFMEPVTKEFGWTRAEFFSAVTLQMVMGIIVVPIVGMLIDRFGSRKIAIGGTFSFAAAFSAYSLANGSVAQWLGLAVCMIVLGGFITQPVWVKPVVQRFEASRGLAMAIALSGNGVGTTIWPIIAAALIGTFGWRTAYPAMAIGWAVVSLPLTLLFFFDKPPSSASEIRAPIAGEPQREGSLMKAVRSSSFLLLVASGAAFSCGVFGLTVHLVPYLRGEGVAVGTAAAIAGLVGICAIIGRVGTGLLLDRFPTRLVGIAVFVLPVITCALLYVGHGSMPLILVAAVALGLASGAEIDVVTFIAARQFDHRIFGSVYAIVMSSFGVAASMGPLLGGALFDASGSYDLFLLCAALLSFLGAALIWRISAGSAPRIDPADLAAAGVITEG